MKSAGSNVELVPPVEPIAAVVEDAPQTPQSFQPAWPSPARAWYAVFVLMVVLLLAIVDRQILNLLVKPIKADLGISDTQMGLLMGFAFVTFYAVLGLPIARLSDVKSRRVVMGVGLVLWSIMTALCGLARTGWQLFAARVGVGVGEACNGPATFSLLSDYFPKERLPTALGVLSIGFYVGSGLANIVGSSVYEFASTLPEVSVPLVGALRPWQLSFVIIGLPGVFVAFLLATVQEPARRGLHVEANHGVHVVKASALPLAEVFRFIRQNARIYGSMYVGLGLRAMLTFGAASWLPTFFQRTYGWSQGDSGRAIGIVQLTAAPAGLVVGGLLAEWLTRRGYHDANMRVTLISTVAMLPSSILYPLMPAAWQALALAGVSSFLATLAIGPFNAALHIITPNQLRAQFTAVYLLVLNLVGSGLGPLIVGVLTDRFFGESGLHGSLSVSFAVLGPLACLALWDGLAPYREAVRRAS